MVSRSFTIGSYSLLVPTMIAKLCVLASSVLFSMMVNADTISAYTDHEPPLNFTDIGDKSYAIGDDVKGFSTDVVREIMLRTGHHGQIAIIPWARSYKLLQVQPNVVLFSMARTPLRENLFHWVGPLSYSKSLIYVKRGSGIVIKSLDDARKLPSIGVLREDSKEQFLRNEGFTNLDYSPLWSGVLKKLLSGRLSAITMTDLDLPIVAQNEGMNAADFEPAFELFVTKLYIGISKSTAPAVVQSWQAALDGMKQDGTFHKLADKWSAHWKADWVVRDGAVQAK